MYIPCEFINCRSYVGITDPHLFRNILAKKKLQIITIPPRNVEEVIWALIWQ